MKTIKQRSYAVLLLAVALLAGMGLYIWRFVNYGRDWAGFRAVLTDGTVTDRNGVTLAHTENGTWTWAADARTRVSCLHAVGDAEKNIGTGALSAFAGDLSGYDLVTGVSGGGTVRLSIDAELNNTAYAALAGRRGAVLVCDYTTGEILCMVSSPSYDPAVGFDASSGNYDGVYLNRALSVAYTPGSVFKLTTLSAAVENIPDLYERDFVCTGSVTVDGNTVTCTAAHGTQTIEQALANSCNCAFAALSLELGGDTLKRYADRFGLTSPLSVSGVYTAAGNFEAAPEGSAALAWSGIGQSTDLVCPAALLRCVSAIANGGSAVGPVLRAGERGGSARLMSAETAEALKAMMNYDVVYGYGAGNFPNLKLCAKSGTAEVGDGTSHAWFTGFLDDPEHPYAFTVVIERGGGGLANAGPVANAVLQKAVGTA